MTVDLWMLVASTMLFFLIYATQGFAIFQLTGLAGAVGGRDDMPVATGWKGRINRTVDNHSDNLIVFATLVMVAHVSQQANEITATGALVFFVARLVHAACYIAGVPWVRTLAWISCVVGMAMILVQLF